MSFHINGGDNNEVFHHDLWGDNFRVKPNELFMDINGGDKNRVFLHDLIKITKGTVSEGTIFMHIFSNKRWANLPSSPKAETSWALDSGDPKWCEWRFRLVVVCSKRTVWPHSIGFPREHCFFGLGPGDEKIQAFKKIILFSLNSFCPWLLSSLVSAVKTS